MDLRHLKTFQVVARTLSFTRAAEQLDYAQSSVTAQIQLLEKELDVQLFNRLGKRISLTDAGNRLLGYADKMLDLADEARVTMMNHGEPTGTLLISAPETLTAYHLPPLIWQFRQQFPRVRLIFQSGSCAVARRSVSDGTANLAFTIEMPNQSNPALMVETLAKEPILLLAHPEHPLAKMERIEADDLRHETLLLTEANCSYRTFFEETLATHGVYLTETMEFGAVEAIKQCACVGLGIAVLPEMAVRQELEQGKLVTLQWEALHMYIQLIWHKNTWLSPALEAFIQMSCEAERNLPYVRGN